MVKSAGVSHTQVESDFDQLEIEVVKERGYGSIHYVYILETLFKKYNTEASNKLSHDRLNEIIDEFNRHPKQPPRLFDGVRETLIKLSKSYNLYILTKGDYKEQSGKVKRADFSNIIDDFFVPPEKNDRTYLDLLNQMNWKAEETCMVGNSPKSDINPALRAGLYTVYIPYENTWKLDHETIHSENGKLITLEKFTDLQTMFIQ